jgi:hypothetical protein
MSDTILLGPDYLPLPTQCTGRSKTRMRTCGCGGDRTCQECRCRNKAIPGGSVCEFHGGAAPQVRKRAEQRVVEQYAEVQDLSISILIMRLKDFHEAQELARINGTPPPIYDDKTLLAIAKVAGDQQLTLQGRATSITESRTIDAADTLRLLEERTFLLRQRGVGRLADDDVDDAEIVEVDNEA